MKILQTSQKHFTLLGVGAEQSKQRLYCNYRILSGSILLGYSLFGHLVYIIYVEKRFDKYIECICATIAMFVIATCFASMVFGMSILFESIDDIESLIETRLQYPTSKALFNETNRRVERVSKILVFIIAKVSPWCAALPKIFTCFIVYFTTDAGNDSFELPFPMWIPFDPKGPIKFLIFVTFQFITIAYELHVIACVLSLAIGAYIFAIASTEEIKNTVHEFNNVVNDQAKTKNQSYILQQLSTFIHAHSTVKQVATNFAIVLQPIFFMLFMWSIIAICGLMLLIQIAIFHHENNSMPLLLTMFGSGYAFGTAFVACDLGQRLNDAFAEIGELMYQCDWHLFSVELRRMSVIILNVLQQPVSFRCFGSISCSREVFKKIVNSAFSYFLALRQFGN